MQSEAVAYETPERRSDSTTSMVAQDSDPLPTQPSFTGNSPASNGRPFDVEASIRSQMVTVPILTLLQQCICALGGPNTMLADPATEVALELLVAFLTTAQQEQLAPDESIAFVPASRYGALLTAAQRTLASIQRHSAPPHPPPARSPASPGPCYPKNPLPNEWAFNCTHCAALGRDTVTSHWQSLFSTAD